MSDLDFDPAEVASVVRLPDDDVRRRRVAAGLVREYESGASIRALSVRCEVGFSTVRRLLLSGGATLRPRGNDGSRKTWNRLAQVDPWSR